MTVEITEQERQFIKEALRYSQMDFERRSSQYSCEEARQSRVEKNEMFSRLQTRFNKEKL